MAKNKLSQKSNISSMQVIKTLKVLIQGNFSMFELIEKLNNNEPQPVFNNSVVSKYINTCRYCGIKIPKINNKYYVANIPFGLDLSVLDIDLINAIRNYAKDEMSSISFKIINALTEKICHFSNKEITRCEKEDFIYSVELFQRAIARKRKICLIFKNNERLVCIPVSITKNGKKTMFNVFNKKLRNIDISRLSGVELSGQRYVEPFCGDLTTVFKLKGELAKRYEARENESVQINSDSTITVTNRHENKELLFSRLLRYDDKCEILQPIIYREEMKTIINDMLRNYGVD